ncbi:hypothetical protein C4D60_Mb10t14010 [Musa balbisiana]|uniref:Uncharacterized protein n=1 Tax=Musa balbisiana TaxID=52838 RepID=A0A4S8IWY1_MUSBA|nr:hypothetical protein C4D60_Mb10t14010 [Musa balbisiana]
MEIGSSLFKMYRSLKPNCQKKGNTKVLDKGDRPAGLGAAADVVELETHEGLHERALPVGLVPHHQHRRYLEGRLELLCQPVKLVVRLVELPGVRRGGFLFLLLILLLLLLLHRRQRGRRLFASSGLPPLGSSALPHGLRRRLGVRKRNGESRQEEERPRGRAIAWAGIKAEKKRRGASK